MDPVRDWCLIGAVPWQLLSFNCQWDLSREMFSEKEISFGLFLMRNVFDKYGHFSEVFWERKGLLNTVFQKLISHDFVLVLCYFAGLGEKGKVGVVRIQSFCDLKVIRASFNLRRCYFCDLEKYRLYFCTNSFMS